MQVSLRSACPWTARRVSGIVTADSDGVFDRMAADGLTAAQAKLRLDHVVRRELAKMARLQALFAADPAPGRVAADRRDDLVHGHALDLLAREGRGAVAAHHEAGLAAAGLGALSISQARLLPVAGLLMWVAVAAILAPT
ncbi:hypothetical protein [Paracoccus sphaerophysae]|uniref:hypothetical protein n=1 Tax=Paracoccus sphaerophysae TaxID=690417 RepID=UPI0023547EF7|nr:hypothetical protein [Paracoccus sphaerophysae]